MLADEGRTGSWGFDIGSPGLCGGLVRFQGSATSCSVARTDGDHKTL
jgi:hypothetical protein